ncbi:MAG TPA: hypothetical protein VME46_26430 [Acidimicrobiales bacterium]|nr:hypothetical protein [Acidimicrobiales bacterium]
MRALPGVRALPGRAGTAWAGTPGRALLGVRALPGRREDISGCVRGTGRAGGPPATPGATRTSQRDQIWKQMRELGPLAVPDEASNLSRGHEQRAVRY